MDKPTLRIEFSRTYSESLEAETLVKILKQLVAHNIILTG